MSRRALFEMLVVTLVKLFGLAAPAYALTDNWLSTSSALWQVGPWSLGAPPLGHPPAATDAAVFNAFGIYTVGFNAATLDPTINDLHLLSGILNFATTAGPMRTLHVTDPSGPRKLTVNGASVRLGFGGAIKFDVGDAVGVTNGDLTVGDGSQLAAAGNIAIGTSAGSSGTLGILGAGSSLTQTGATTLTVGSNTTGTSALVVGLSTSGGTLTTGTGLFTINKTGEVRVGNGFANTGTLNANGDILIDGGQLIVASGDLITTAGKTITIQNGGSLTVSSYYLYPNSIIFTAGSFTSDYFDLRQVGGSLALTNNRHLTATVATNVVGGGLILDGGTLNTDNMAVNNGGTFEFNSGTLATTAAAALSVALQDFGMFNPEANANFSNNVSATFNGGLSIGGPANVGGTSIVNIQTGADLTVGGASITSYTQSATLNIVGAGSTVTLNPATNLLISGSFLHPGSVNVESGGALTVGIDGVTDLFPVGILNINGGIVDLKTLNYFDGTINFTAGSLSYIGSLTVGTNGLLGTNLTLASNRQLTLSGTTTVDFSRTLTLDGGTLNTSSLVLSGTLNFSSGVLSVTAPGGLIINTGGKLAGNGTMTGNVQNDGLVSPGTSPGTLTITGNYTQGATGTLKIELASASLDKLVVTGTANFAGTLDIDLIGFTPAAGNSFDILDFATRNGSFFLDLPGLPGSLAWNTSQLYTTGLLSIILPGDYNQNGAVDTADYAVWRDRLGSGSSLPNDDTPGVGQDDYNRWRAHFGQTAGSGAIATAAIPEPASLVLLLAAFIGLVAARAPRQNRPHA